MAKFGCGIAMLALGAILAIWLAYNLLIERQAEFVVTLPGLAFLAGLVFVGFKWVMEGRESMSERKPPRRKKRRRRPPDEDE